ncbi:MAG: hypothetical protein EOO17_05830 [Chloroflexi bacterium]|nr:MAG: hypothetical protein EOO17_05830 [Chloroflexota bacterium]
MSLEARDKVEALELLRGGILSTDVKEGTRGLVLSVNVFGTKADVSFEKGGVGWPAKIVKDVDIRKLKKL